MHKETRIAFAAEADGGSAVVSIDAIVARGGKRVVNIEYRKRQSITVQLNSGQIGKRTDSVARWGHPVVRDTGIVPPHGKGK